MKKITAYLIITIITCKIYCQGIDQFVGKFYVTEIYTIIEGGMPGYTDTVDYTITIIKNNENQVSILHFSNNNNATVIADVELDSIKIPSQIVNTSNGTISIVGSGEINKDTLDYVYRSGGSFGVASCTCTAIRLVENSINENDTQFKIAKSYPMPFTDRTTVEIDVPSDIINARMKIFNMHGIEVYNTEIEERGLQNFSIEGRYLSSGYYTCLFLFDNKVEYYCKIIKK